MKEFKAADGKGFINIDHFGYGSMIVCADNVNSNIIEVSKEDALYFHNKYEEQVNALYENEEMQYAEKMEQAIENIRLSLIQEIIDKGYSLTSVSGNDNTDIEEQLRALLNE